MAAFFFQTGILGVISSCTLLISISTVLYLNPLACWKLQLSVSSRLFLDITEYQALSRITHNGLAALIKSSVFVNTSRRALNNSLSNVWSSKCIVVQNFINKSNNNK